MKGTKRKVIVGFILFLVSGLTYYLFLKPSDYLVVFTVRESAEVVSQQAYQWRNWNRRYAGNRMTTSVTGNKNQLTTMVSLQDTTLKILWRFQALNDSTTRVTVGVSDHERRFHNRITAPFKATPFRSSIESNMVAFSESVHNLADRYNWVFNGLDSLKSVPVVYISFRTSARRKSGEMIGNVIELNQFVKENELELVGHPFIHAKYKGGFQDSIDFEFCFPIAKYDRVPEHPQIKFKFTEPARSLKAEYYGNYALSDMAWYRLHTKASDKRLLHKGELVEIFLNDPHSGGNDKEWRADVHLLLQ